MRRQRGNVGCQSGRRRSPGQRRYLAGSLGSDSDSDSDPDPDPDSEPAASPPFPSPSPSTPLPLPLSLHPTLALLLLLLLSPSFAPLLLRLRLLHSIGVPSSLKIASSCPSSESPANRGRHVAISARTQPALQTSTGVE